VDVNTSLTDDPAQVNSDPYGAGWMLRLRLSNESELDTLLGPQEYQKHIGG
jgi:glycine cleavage system H protein